MTLTISVNSNYEKVTGKTLTPQAELTSQLKTAIVDVVYASCEDYDIAGNVVDLSLDGRFDTIIAVEVMETTIGVVAQYVHGANDAATLGKLKIYESGTASAALDEADNADAINATFRLRVVGY
jgi:hypothetical protein